MSELDTPAPDEIQDTPTDAAPDVDTQQPVVDYEARYHSLRPEFDRKSQRLAELEELFAQSQQTDTPDDDEDFEYDFEDSVARQAAERAAREVAELKAQLLQQQEKADRDSYITSELEAIEAATKDEFDEDESDWIGNYALNHPDEHGNPDVRAAYERFNRIFERRKSKWASGKRADRPAAGPGAVEVPDLDDPEQREQYIDRLMSGE